MSRSTLKTSAINAYKSPGDAPEYLLGTDESVRDVLSRLIWGARTSLVVALAARLASALPAKGGQNRATITMSSVTSFIPMAVSVRWSAALAVAVAMMAPIAP